jgi:hypothetical protein
MTATIPRTPTFAYIVQTIAAVLTNHATGRKMDFDSSFMLSITYSSACALQSKVTSVDVAGSSVIVNVDVVVAEVHQLTPAVLDVGESSTLASPLLRPWVTAVLVAPELTVASRDLADVRSV